MKLIEVHDKLTATRFIDLPRSLYKNDPDFICPLDNDIEAIFDPSLNSNFAYGNCKRWILENENGYTIGRIAAFYNNKKAFLTDTATGGCGFFDCINDRNAANLLFDTAKEWLRSNGMQAMEGPINFGENDKYWGLLIEGFKPPSMGMNYNPPYYQAFFEDYGFVKNYDQLTNFLDLQVPFTERFTKIASWVRNKPEYNFRHFVKKDFEAFADDFMETYNDAWSNFEEFAPMEKDTIRESFRQMKPIVDPKIVWFAYHHEEPIAFVVCLPDINQILKHVNGKLTLWGKIKFFWYLKTTTIERLRIIIMGCKKKYQNKGIESALIQCLHEVVIPNKKIKGVELAWVGDFNDKMMAIHEATGAKRDKVHRTYRYKFQ
jgi:hypothetical protein